MAGTEGTLRAVIVSIFNDFLDGDFEIVLTLLRRSVSVREIMIFLACLGGINDLSASLRLGDEGVGSIFLTLQGLRDHIFITFPSPDYTWTTCRRTSLLRFQLARCSPT